MKGLGNLAKGFILYPLGSGKLCQAGGILTGKQQRLLLRFRIIMLVATWRHGRLFEKERKSNEVERS